LEIKKPLKGPKKNNNIAPRKRREKGQERKVCAKPGGSAGIGGNVYQTRETTLGRWREKSGKKARQAKGTGGEATGEVGNPSSSATLA